MTDTKNVAELDRSITCRDLIGSTLIETVFGALSPVEVHLSREV